MAEEECTLRELSERGEFLILNNNRKFRVNPPDTATSTTWKATAKLQLLDGGEDPFPLTFRNLETGESVRAAKA